MAKVDWSGVDKAREKERDERRNRAKEIRNYVEDTYGTKVHAPKDFDLTKKEQKAAERKHKRERPSDFSGKGAGGVKTYGTSGARRGGI